MDEKSYFKNITKIGVIADIQYCDEEDGSSFDGCEVRRYREALNVTRRAAKTFEEFEIGAVLQLGDAFDGKSKGNFKRDFCERICPILEIPLTKTNEETGTFRPSVAPRMDVMGNHELYCATREELSCILRDYDKEKDLLCYSKVIANGRWRLITLDSYGVSLMGHDTNVNDSSRLKEAKSILSNNNPNVLKQGDKVDWFEGLPVEKYRYVPYNGAIGKEQIEWFQKELKESWNQNQYVVVFSHIPMSGQTNHPKTLHWDMEDALKLIKENGSHVVACIGGHRHSFDYQFSDEFETKCHHLDLPSPLVEEVGGEAHAVIEFSVRNIPVLESKPKESAVITEARSSSSQCSTLEAADHNLSLLSDLPKSCPDEELVYHDGKLFKNDKNAKCDTKNEVALLTVHGFGQIPHLMILPKEKPSKW